MKPDEHGGDILRAARETGIPPAEILDFSASINPLGMPTGVAEAARAALPDAVHYPEPDAAALRRRLAEHHGMDAVALLPGAGSTELLYLFPRVLRPRRALVVVPAFSEYARALQQAGTLIDTFALRAEDGFRLDPVSLLHRLAPETDLVLLANPGNPTGAAVPPETVEEVAAAVREQALLLVDEAFADFAPGLSVLPRVAEHENLYVLRSLTKFYAIPGLRAGYLVGPPRGIARLAAGREPWTLSTVALAAATACLDEEAYRQRTLAEIPRLRRGLSAGLEALGLGVFPGSANYLLARRRDGGTAAELAAALRQQGILIRDCANFPPLDERFFRVAVRAEEENERLLCVLAATLGGQR